MIKNCSNCFYGIDDNKQINWHCEDCENSSEWRISPIFELEEKIKKQAKQIGMLKGVLADFLDRKTIEKYIERLEI